MKKKLGEYEYEGSFLNEARSIQLYQSGQILRMEENLAVRNKIRFNE